jgi:hypothetical protein
MNGNEGKRREGADVTLTVGMALNARWGVMVVRLTGTRQMILQFQARVNESAQIRFRLKL